MEKIEVAPYGSWQSPISSQALVAETVGLGQICLDGDWIYWVESRPAEGGRCVIVACDRDGRSRALTGPQYNVLSRVHEYGGGAFCVHQGTIYFVNLADQGIYCQAPDTQPAPLLVAPGLRFADLSIDAARNRLIAVCEDHRGADEPVNTLVAIDRDSAECTVLAAGADFYSSPALAHGQLAWLSWDHPRMPWNGTELWVASFAEDGSLRAPLCIAGGEQESVFQPQWSADGDLYFVSDRSGWWNLYRWRQQAIKSLKPMAAEFGQPQWIFGMSTYAVADDGWVVCAYRQHGEWAMARLHPHSGAFVDMALPYTSFDSVRCANGQLVCVAGSPTAQAAVVRVDLADNRVTELRHSSTLRIARDDISAPEAIAFATGDGATAYAFFYPPRNSRFRGPDDELPLLLVKSHGGPTASTSSVLNPAIQYWTSRGFAVVDVNYRGSSGYGRAYREQLRGRWGIADVDDCVAVTRYLAAAGKVDGERCAIRGNSAGGYTTLAALTFHDTFRAGASYYGISDLEILARDTHKFESRYLDYLIGPYPEQRAIYLQRSPIHYSQNLSAPVIFFQGLEDQVVPPNQAQLMVDVLRQKKVPVAYVAFAEERHGFRKADNIKRAIEAELYFYARIFKFELAEAIEPVAIENLA